MLRALTAVLLVLPGLLACRKPLRAVKEPRIQYLSEGLPKGRKSDLTSGEEAAEKAKPGGGAVKKAVLASQTSAPKKERFEEEDREPSITEHYRSALSTAALDTGEKAEAGQPQGRPAVRRPEEEQLAFPGPPTHYNSPAPLRELRGGRRMPAIVGADFGDEDGVGGLELAAKRPKDGPPLTPILDDSLPALGISDPDVIGSYHVQISSGPDFTKVLFEKTYPFMSEVDLAEDLAGAPDHVRALWIRYSVVDLLDFEHPFTRPRRILRLRPGERR